MTLNDNNDRKITVEFITEQFPFYMPFFLFMFSHLGYF